MNATEQTAHHTRQYPKKFTNTDWKVRPYVRPDQDDDPMLVYQLDAGDLQQRYEETNFDDEERMAEIHAENRANAKLMESARMLLDILSQCITEPRARCLHTKTEEDFRHRLDYINIIARDAIDKATK